ncbi:MAG: TIGR03086 family protein [Acidimicrobiales bacterium]|nr:MAG: TIGR03086 family protein [Acidimicrobiales bacterium]
MTMTTSTDKTADLLQPVLADLAEVVASVTDEQLHDPTPCTEFDVEQLRDHVIGWLTNFADGFADPHGKAPHSDIEGYRAPTDAAAQVRSAADRLDRAIRDGAGVRPLRLGESEMPGDMALGMILWEYQVHGWDLARATDQPWSPPAEAAEASLAFAPAMLTDDYQGEGKSFAHRVAVPHDAPPLDRLLGLSGRDPSWSAPDHRSPTVP